MSLIPTKETPQPTTLEEKTKGFKFNIPIGQKNEPNKTEIKNPSIIPATNSSDEPKIQTIQSEEKTTNGLLSSPAIKQETNISELSDEKYVLVADAIPEISDASIERFKKHLTQLQDAVITNNTNNLQTLMKDTLEYLSENPELNKYIAVEDRAIFVAACRLSAGITVKAKKERVGKKKVIDADVDGLLGQLAEIDLKL